MKAAVIDRFGKPEVFSYRDVDDPVAGEGELVIKVEACGINRYELYLRMGAVFTDIAFPHVLGADVAGVVAEVGPGVDGWSVGDRAVVAPGFPLEPGDWDIVPENHAPSFEVTGTHTWGGNAEYIRMASRFVVRDITGLPAADVAAMPLVLMTAMNAVKTLGEVTSGSRVLVQAGASGSGNACVQVAKALGAEVATTVGSPEKVTTAEQAGADLVIQYHKENFADRLLDWTNGTGVDVVIDNIGGSVFADNLRALRHGGIFVNFGLVGGISAQLNFRDLFFKRHQLRGSFMGSMEGLRVGLAMMTAGKVKAVIDKTFPLSDIAEAHRYIDSRAVRGKVVLIP
ncbi:MAG: quinone oxidoreductase family protein [Planctomycetota bacterium]|jgi:NADPH:quinone reductase-like Zn-dependent oxidoreductase